MWKQKPTYNRPLIFKKSIPDTQKATVRRLRRIIGTSSRSIIMKFSRIRKKFSYIPLLLLISLRFKTLKNITKADNKTVQPPGLIPPR